MKLLKPKKRNTIPDMNLSGEIWFQTAENVYKYINRATVEDLWTNTIWDTLYWRIHLGLLLSQNQNAHPPSLSFEAGEST